MLGLPSGTELSKQLPKTAIYRKFNMNSAAKERFDADISRITIAAEISTATTNIPKGESISSIYVLLVTLKRKDFEERTISQVSKLIDQNMLLVLEFEGKYKLAIFHTKLIQSDWQNSEDCMINIKGLNLDAVWENLIVQVGDIEIAEENTLDEQIVIDEQKAKLQKEIARLEKQARAEKQPKKKFELVQMINKLKSKGDII